MFVDFSAFFPALEFGMSNGLFLVRTVSVPLSPSWHCFCWYYSHKNLVGLVWSSLGFTPLDKSYPHESLWDKPFSLASCWDSKQCPWVSCRSCCLTERICKTTSFQRSLCAWMLLWGTAIHVSEVLTEDSQSHQCCSIFRSLFEWHLGLQLFSEAISFF